MVENSHDRELFETKLELCETAILQLIDMPIEAFQRSWASFQLEGADFKARYFVFGDQAKPTLVMTHGYATYALSHFMIFKSLAKHYRVIAFDNSSFGGNTRLNSCSGLESPEKADAYMIEWQKGFFEAIDHLLPAKYLLYGASNGAYQLGLFASVCPDRIEKLFLCSPVGFVGISQTYDPYAIRV